MVFLLFPPLLHPSGPAVFLFLKLSDFPWGTAQCSFMLKKKQKGAMKAGAEQGLLSTETTFESLGLDARLTKALARAHFIKPTLVQATSIPIAFQVSLLQTLLFRSNLSSKLDLHFREKTSCAGPAPGRGRPRRTPCPSSRESCSPRRRIRTRNMKAQRA